MSRLMFKVMACLRKKQGLLYVTIVASNYMTSFFFACRSAPRCTMCFPPCVLHTKLRGSRNSNPRSRSAKQRKRSRNPKSKEPKRQAKENEPQPQLEGAEARSKGTRAETQRRSRNFKKRKTLALSLGHLRSPGAHRRPCTAPYWEARS